MNFYFVYPSFLYLLLVIPFVVLFYFLSISYNKRKAVVFSNFEALERISGVEFFSKSFFVLFLDLILILFIVLSLAQLNVVYTARTDSFSHVILLDNSRSMSVEDIGTSRLSLGKNVAKSFVGSMPLGVEFGVVAFAGESRIFKRIDSSELATRSAIDNIDFSSVEGSVLFNAILLADSLFSGQKKSILVVSDGEFSFSDLSDILNYAEEKEIVVNTILVGSEQGGTDEFGGLHKINKEVMKALAFNTGGKFFETSSSEIPSNFEEVFVETRREIRLDLTIYLLLLALVIFLLDWLANNFRLRMFS